HYSCLRPVNKQSRSCLVFSEPLNLLEWNVGGLTCTRAVALPSAIPSVPPTAFALPLDSVSICLIQAFTYLADVGSPFILSALITSGFHLLAALLPPPLRDFNQLIGSTAVVFDG